MSLTATAQSSFHNLPHLVVLEILSYLSCEDALYAFACLSILLEELLAERGAFRHIRLSSSLSRRQWLALRNVWCWNTVRSLTIQGMFNNFVVNLIQWPLPSLTELRIIRMPCLIVKLDDFIIAHASTLTHLTCTPSNVTLSKPALVTIVHTVLPHLNRLTHLYLGWYNVLKLRWMQLPVMNSIIHVSITVEKPSDMYDLATRLPCLRNLRVVVSPFGKNYSSSPPPYGLQLADIETFVYVSRRQRVAWSHLEAFTSENVMPRLRRCTFKLEIRFRDFNSVRHSSLLNNKNNRNVRVQYIFEWYTSDTEPMRSTAIVELDDEVQLERSVQPTGLVYHLCHKYSWPSCIAYSLKLLPNRRILSARRIRIKVDTSLNELAERFPRARELFVEGKIILSISASRSLPLMPTVDKVVLFDSPIHGSEHLMSMLPNLRVVEGTLVELFVAVARHPNIGTLFNGVERLEIYDSQMAHSMKQWHLVLNAFSQLRSLFVCTLGRVCPSSLVANLLVQYVDKSLRLISFSLCMRTERGYNDKIKFVSRVRQGLEQLYPPIHIVQSFNTRLEAWKY